MTLYLKIYNHIDPGRKGKPVNKELRQLDINELNHLSEQIEENPEKAANMLFPNNPSDRLMLTKKIAQWAINQTLVLESSQHNKTDVALIFHKVGERIWQQLPSYARSVTIVVE
jgi:hypothetical protein